MANVVIQPEAGQFRFSGEAAVMTVTVLDPPALRNALKKRDAIIILGTPELERRFRWLEFWQGREGTYRLIAILMALLAAFAIAHGLKIEASLLHDWKLERTEGKLTLTPLKK